LASSLQVIYGFVAALVTTLEREPLTARKLQLVPGFKQEWCAKAAIALAEQLDIQTEQPRPMKQAEVLEVKTL